jgi:hypothetical protein
MKKEITKNLLKDLTCNRCKYFDERTKGSVFDATERRWNVYDKSSKCAISLKIIPEILTCEHFVRHPRMFQ